MARWIFPMFHRLKPGRTGSERATRGATWPSAASREAKNNVASPRGEREHGKAPDSRLPLEEGCQDTVFPAPNFCGEEIYARILSKNFAGKEFTRVSCPKSSLARNLRAYLVPKPRWEGIYARILLQIPAGKKFTRVSCSKSPLARNLRAYLVQNLRWQEIYARILSQILAGKEFTRVSCSKSSLGRCRGAILAAWRRRHVPPAAVETWRAASPSSNRAATHIGRTRASRESASRGRRAASLHLGRAKDAIRRARVESPPARGGGAPPPRRGATALSCRRAR